MLIGFGGNFVGSTKVAWEGKMRFFKWVDRVGGYIQ